MAHDRQALAELCYRVALAEGEFSGDKPPNMTDRLKAVDLICRLQLTPSEPAPTMLYFDSGIKETLDEILKRLPPGVDIAEVLKCEL